ncbi:MAG: Ig-like domain-containing protein [Anaerolineae bacterium]|nr:Ig-like domain-containing protein [Anaerolineae bacterium]
MDTPFPDQVATVRVRGRDQEGCITHWSDPIEVSWEVCYPGAPAVTGVTPATGSDSVTIRPSLVVTYNEAIYIGSPANGLQAPQASLSLPPSVGDLSFRAEAVVPVTDVWALAVRYVPLWNQSIPSLEEWTAYTATVAGAMDAMAQAVTATWTFTTGDFTQPEVVGTVPEKGSQEGAPQEVIAYFGEDVSTAEAWFILVGPKGELEGELTYYNDASGEPEGPSCYHWHFTPYDPLTAGQYTAEVFGVTDRAGLEMEAPYEWSFEVTEEIGGELLAPPAKAPRAAEPVEREPEEDLPAAGAREAKAAVLEEPLETPAGDGGEIESGMAGVLYVRSTSYYYFGGQRVAMRQTSSWGENVVYYLVTDHLGTTSLVLDAAGGRVAESRHYPYGAERWIWTADGSGTLPTDYRFTVYDAISAGKAENAIFTSAPKISEGAQGQFEGAYRVAQNGKVIADKALEEVRRPSFWTKFGAAASSAWQGLKAWGTQLTTNLASTEVVLPFFYLPYGAVEQMLQP